MTSRMEGGGSPNRDVTLQLKKNSFFFNFGKNLNFYSVKGGGGPLSLF